MAIQDLTQDEKKRLDEERKQHEQTLQSSKNLEATIKALAKNNARSDNETKFTDNRLNIKKYSDSMRDVMSGETSKLFDQLEDINVNSRQQSKHEQRDNLQQLDVLRELSKNVQNNEQRVELQKYIDTTEQTIRTNTNKFSAFMSKTVDNFGDVTAVIAGLNDSPLLAMGAAYFGGKIKENFSQKREQKYNLQSGMEDQLFELLQQREKSAKKQDALLAEIASKNDKSITNDDKSISITVDNDNIINELELNNDELVSINDNLKNLKTTPTTSDSREPSIVNVNDNQSIIPELDYSSFDVDSLSNLLEEANYELINIQSTIESFLDNVQNIGTRSQEPVQVALNDDFSTINEQLININTKLEPLVNGLEERRREDEIYNDKLLGALRDLKGKSSSSSDDDNGSILGKVFDGVLNPKKLLKNLVKPLTGALKHVGKAIPRLLSRIALPALIVGTLYSGVESALDTFNKTGSIREAVIDYFGGMVDFLTFGLLDGDSFRKMGDELKNYSEGLYNALTYPLEKFTELVTNVMNGDFEGIAKAIFELNPVGIITDGLITAFEWIGEQITDIFNDSMKGLDNMMNSFKNSLKLPSLDLDFKMPWTDDNTPLKNDKKSIKNNDLQSIDSGRTSLRENINSVYLVNEVPMNKQDYKKVAKKVLNPSTKAGGNNSFSNINVANNNQTIVAPLPIVYNDDYYIRNNLSNNPF
ncbi:hypothetical protein [Pseudoalteromonas sp. ECSMB14103]|uniref:hypothetical protein n=1 Tax=Pseudoalteromonas sp. ECSMB14103 TaxID=1580062 RepID=UPI000579E617|nr:hypothetical protein [Pseudoalteromonas sp. ECSMB14103]